MPGPQRTRRATRVWHAGRVLRVFPRRSLAATTRAGAGAQSHQSRERGAYRRQGTCHLTKLPCPFDLARSLSELRRSGSHFPHDVATTVSPKGNETCTPACHGCTMVVRVTHNSPDNRARLEGLAVSRCSRFGPNSLTCFRDGCGGMRIASCVSDSLSRRRYVHSHP